MANKWLKRSAIPEHISEIVKERTGMSEQELLNDVKVYHINNMQEAIAMFTNAAIKREMIVFHTDYDGDGINCANIARNLASILGITDSVKVVVPRRFQTAMVYRFDMLKLMQNGDVKFLFLQIMVLLPLNL